MRGPDSRSDGILAYLCMSPARKSSVNFLLEKPAGVTCPGRTRLSRVCSPCFYACERREGNCGSFQLSPSRKVD